MKPCRDCRHEISEQAFACPRCGAPYPARDSWDGWVYEYKSALSVAGLPLLHAMQTTPQPNWPMAIMPRATTGVRLGWNLNATQFGIGVFSICQFTVAGFALAQFALGYSLIAQLGVYLGEGHGQLVFDLSQLLRLL